MNYKSGNVELSEQPKQPKQIKFEVETKFEALIMKLIIAALVIAPILLFICFLAGVSFIYIILLVFVDVVVAIMLIATRFLIDEHYILDNEKKVILIKSKIFSKEKVSLLTSFNAISAVVSNGKRSGGGKNGSKSIWSYRTEIITNTGKLIPINNWEINGFGRANSTAIQISNLTPATYINSKSKMEYMPISQRGKFTFTEKKTSTIEIILIFGVALLVLGFMIYFATHFVK